MAAVGEGLTVGADEVRVVVVCTVCDHVWESTGDALSDGRDPTGCPRCGGWTWTAELAEGAVVGSASARDVAVRADTWLTVNRDRKEPGAGRW